MFDVHNAIDEAEPHAVLVDRYFDRIRHVHVNELDGKHCGAGDYDFKPVLDTLRRRNYRGLGLAGSLRLHAGRRAARQRIAPPPRIRNRQTAIMSHYVVTGGAGFIGSAIVRSLLREGARKVVVIDNLLTGHERNLEEVRGVGRFPARRHPQL